MPSPASIPSTVILVLDGSLAVMMRTIFRYLSTVRLQAGHQSETCAFKGLGPGVIRQLSTVAESIAETGDAAAMVSAAKPVMLDLELH